MFPESLEFHIAPKVNDFVDWLVVSFAPFFDSVSAGILKVLLSINGFLNAVPWWLLIGVVALTVWSTTKKILPTLVLSLLPFIIGVFGLWGLAMETLSVVCTAVILALLLGIPQGIFMAEVPGAAMVLKPVLDAMQTMPSFVYLIPAMMLFGLGKVPRGAGHPHLRPSPGNTAHRSGAPAGSRLGGGGRHGLWSHPVAASSGGANSSGHALHSCGGEPDYHDGPGHGGGGLHDRCPRAGAGGASLHQPH